MTVQQGMLKFKVNSERYPDIYVAAAGVDDVFPVDKSVESPL